jgi:hypothetical protein
MIRSRTKQPDVTAPEPAEGVAETTPDDLPAAVGQLRAESADARDRAERGELEAQALIERGDAEAEAIKSSARTRALAARAVATADRREAVRLEERARVITAAISEQEKGAEAVQRAADLEAERVHLADTIADLDGKLAGLRTNRDEAEAELALARTAADVDKVTALRSRLAGVDDLDETLARERQQAADRAAAIGDGSGETGEFGAACSAAADRYAEARKLLNIAYPTRAEAVLDAALEHLQGALEGNRQRIADESAAKPQPRQIVYL